MGIRRKFDEKQSRSIRVDMESLNREKAFYKVKEEMKNMFVFQYKY